MFKKLRIRLVMFTTLALLIVLAVIMTLINVMNYKSVSKNADFVLDALAEFDGRFPNNWPPMGGTMTEETPYETRYFFVRIFQNKYTGVWETFSNTDMVASVSMADAHEYAQKIWSSNPSRVTARGYVDNYRYLFIAQDEGYLIIFMDCGRLLSAVNSFLMWSLIISLAGLIVVVVIIALFSGKIVGPIADSYYKQRQFITNASHELKTPLTIISANSELIEIESGESESTQSIQRQVARMNAMVKNMSALAMLEEAGAMGESTTFDFSDAVRDSAEAIALAATAKNIDVDLDIESGIMYQGSENLIRQFINILMDNALKYSRSYIRVELSRAGKTRIEFTVSNDTDGIDEGNLDHYFERFNRASASRASGIEGSGIGLSVAKEIIALHKGKIAATSTDGVYFNIKTTLFY